MAVKRIRISKLETLKQVAFEHALVYREFKRGKIEPSVASRRSQILVNQKAILEAAAYGQEIAEIKQLLLEAQEMRTVDVTITPSLLTGINSSAQAGGSSDSEDLRFVGSDYTHSEVEPE
jgi:hypothetical protein